MVSGDVKELLKKFRHQEFQREYEFATGKDPFVPVDPLSVGRFGSFEEYQEMRASQVAAWLEPVIDVVWRGGCTKEEAARYVVWKLEDLDSAKNLQIEVPDTYTYEEMKRIVGVGPEEWGFV
jgi:hypothetical protein